MPPVPAPSAASRSTSSAHLPRPSLLASLAECLMRHAPGDGIHETAWPGLAAARSAQPSAEMSSALHQAAVCVIAQGSKQVMLEGEVFDYDAAHFLLFSVDLPVSGRVTQATPEVPYLCMRFDLDLGRVGERLLTSGTHHLAAATSTPRGLYRGPADEALLDTVLRMMRLLDGPASDLAALAPLLEQELLHRLLASEQGPRLALMAQAGSQACRVAKAIAWLKTHYAQPLRIADLADEVHMSASSLHQHFRAVTAMSPLQYQKRLRLQEARRLLVGGLDDIAHAAYRVGYESPSQFTREYSRLFGAPPSRDQARLRAMVPPLVVG